MVVGTVIIELQLPGAQSLKDKRSVLKRLMAQVHKRFNVSCGEVDLHDAWQSSSIGVAVVSTSAVHANNVLENIMGWIELNHPDLILIGYSIDIVHC